jgi:hypothetical protein
MRVNGEWLLCDDGAERPVIRGEVATTDGVWLAAEFLVDTGADRTVLNADLLSALGLPPITTGDRIQGVGGFADSVVVETQVRLRRDDGGLAVFRGQYPAATNLEALDMSVLGRDITGLFAVVVDRPGSILCLLGQRHQYTIQQH